MTAKFKVGDYVTWNSEAGHVSGKIIKIHTNDTDYKGHTHPVSARSREHWSANGIRAAIARTGAG